MHNFYFLFATFFAVFSFSEAKGYHPVPTFFKRIDKNGNLIDANSEEYKLKGPFDDTIAEENANANLKVWPEVAENGGRVTVLWSGMVNQTEKDFIGYYCPYVDKATHPVDYVPVTDSDTWQQGYGHIFLTVYNMRYECVFRYYSTNRLVAQSNSVTFTDGGEVNPLHGHLAMTTEPTEMRVMWNSFHVGGTPIVKYGLTPDLNDTERSSFGYSYESSDMCEEPANSTGFWNPGYTYDIVLRYLLPNTRYYYSYGVEGYMSRMHNFTTPIPPGDETPFKFIVYGDMGVDGFPEATTTAELVRKEIDSNDVRFVFHHGDISYARGHAWIWDQWFYLIEPYATLIPYMVGVGNHEQDHINGHEKDPSKQPNFRPSWFNGGTDSGGECGVPMSKRFHMPDNGLGIWWYSFEMGMIHMIMMSTEHDYSPGSNQYKWLENDLKNVDRTKTPFVLIGGHRPMYCSGAVHSDYVVSVNMQELFENLLYEYKVDLALWAHYHTYERTCKVYKGNCTDDGVTHIVVGSAGKSIDEDVWYPKPWSLFRLTDYGYGRISVANSTHMLYEFVQNRFNKVADYVWIVRIP